MIALPVIKMIGSNTNSRTNADIFLSEKMCFYLLFISVAYAWTTHKEILLPH